MTSEDTALAAYGGVYRAVCLEVLVDRARVQIPQLFAAETVTIFEFAGPRPVSGDEGWVFFEAELAERPVWAGAESAEELPPGGTTGQVLTKQADGSEAWQTPPVAAAYYWYGLFTNPGTLTTNTPVQVPVAAALRASGFHLGAGQPGAVNAVVVEQAGRYRVSATATFTGGGGTGMSVNIEVRQYRAAVQIAAQMVGTLQYSAPITAGTVEGVFDCQVGDTLSVVVTNQEVAASKVLDVTRSAFVIIPVGGAKGDKGDAGMPGSAANIGGYYHANAVAAASLPANTYTLITWTLKAANSFTGAGVSSVVCQQAGRYLVVADISSAVSTAGGTIIGRLRQVRAGSPIETREVLGSGAFPAPEVSLNGIFDVQVGDSIDVAVNGSVVNNSIDVRSWLSIVPVGGAKGDKGDTGLDVTLVQSSYWYGQFAVVPILANSAPTALTVLAPLRSSGFHLGASQPGGYNSPVVEQAGRYRVSALCLIDGSYAGTQTMELRHYRGATLVQSFTFFQRFTASGTDGAPPTEAVFDCLVGDTISTVLIYSGAATTANLDARSYLTIMPVGGTKGDKGDKGDTGPGAGPDEVRIQTSAPAIVASEPELWVDTSVSTTPALKYWNGTAWSLVASGGALSSEGVRRRHSVAQSIPNNAATAVALDTQVDLVGGQTYAYDTTNRWITIPADGLYLIQGQVQGENQQWVATQVYSSIRINGVDVALQYPSGSAYDVIQSVASLPLKAGDHVQLVFYGNAGSALTIRGQAAAAGAPISPMLAVWRLGGAKGDKGDTGPDVTQQQSSYFYGQGSGPASAAANVWTIMQWAMVQSNGINLATNTNITITRAGRYRVAAQIGGYSTGAGSNLNFRVYQYDSTPTMKFTRDTAGGVPNYNGGWTTSIGEAVLDCVVGDIIQIAVNPNVLFNLSPTQSWVEVTPIGGTKGDQGAVGPTGNPGVAEHAPVWVPLTLGAGWTNYGSNFQTARVTRKHGIVHVEGLVVSAAGAAGAATNLPLGYRPAASLIYLNHSQAAASGGTRQDIGANGDVTSGPIPTAYASIVSSFVADPAFGIEYGFDAPTVTITDATTISATLPGGLQWENGVRMSRPQATVPVAVSANQWGYVNTLSVGGGFTTFAAALAAARANRSATSIPAWIVGRDGAGVLTLTDIREWF